MKEAFDLFFLLLFYFGLKEKSSQMRSHSPLKSSEIIRPALRSFKKKAEREREGERDVSCMCICINMTEELK